MSMLGRFCIIKRFVESPHLNVKVYNPAETPNFERTSHRQSQKHQISSDVIRCLWWCCWCENSSYHRLILCAIRAIRAIRAILCHPMPSCFIPVWASGQGRGGSLRGGQRLGSEVATRHVVAQTQHAAWRTTAQLGNGLDNCNINGLDNCNTL